MEINQGVHDILVVGAGPAGLTVSVMLCRLGIKPLLVDAGTYVRHEWGRAEVLHSRMLEVFESLGEPYHYFMNMSRAMSSQTFWKLENGAAERTLIQPYYAGAIDFNVPHPRNLRQGLIEEILLRDAEHHNPGFCVNWQWKFVDMDSQGSGEPCKVTLQHVETNETKVVLAKYVLGTDGARSAVRGWAAKFGVSMETQPTTDCSHVRDLIGVTSDFPDLERLSLIASEKGVVINVPKDPIAGKRVTRLSLQPTEDPSGLSKEEMSRLVKSMIAPFRIDWDEISWESSFTVTQSLVNEYMVKDKVILLGDACHTHSPRGGLGMNTSMLEGHNLGWKLALVLKGIAKPEILSTYGGERHPVAYNLISMDRQLVQAAAKYQREDVKEIDNSAVEEHEDIQKIYEITSGYSSGSSIVYSPNLLVTPPNNIAEVFAADKPSAPVGGRTRPALMKRLSDGSIISVHPRFDGRFTIFLLVGDLKHPETVDSLLSLDDYITSSGSIFTRYGESVRIEDTPIHLRMRPIDGNIKTGSVPIPEGRKLYTYEDDDLPQIDGGHGTRSHSLFRSMVITTTKDAEVFQLHPFMARVSPFGQSKSRLLHPSRLFSDSCAAVSPFEEAILRHPVHEKWGIDQGVGATVVVRPDGHVGMRADGYGISAWKEVEKYFSGFLL